MSQHGREKTQEASNLHKQLKNAEMVELGSHRRGRQLFIQYQMVRPEGIHIQDIYTNNLYWVPELWLIGCGFLHLSATGRCLCEDDWTRHPPYAYHSISLGIFAVLFCWSFLSLVFGSALGLWAVLLLLPGHPGSIGHGLSVVTWVSC